MVDAQQCAFTDVVTDAQSVSNELLTWNALDSSSQVDTLYAREVGSQGKIGVYPALLLFNPLTLFCPVSRRQVDTLYAGEVGYLAAQIKSVLDARVGDTVTLQKVCNDVEGLTQRRVHCVCTITDFRRDWWLVLYESRWPRCGVPCQVCVAPGCWSDIDCGAQAYVTASVMCTVLCKDCTSGVSNVPTAAEWRCQPWFRCWVGTIPRALSRPCRLHSAGVLKHPKTSLSCTLIHTFIRRSGGGSRYAARAVDTAAVL